MKISIERAIEILDPEHEEHYSELPDGMEQVNEACRMGMEALREKLGDRIRDKVRFSDLEAVSNGLMMVWAEEPGRGICVEMTYNDLIIIMDALDRAKSETKPQKYGGFVTLDDAKLEGPIL